MAKYGSCEMGMVVSYRFIPKYRKKKLYGKLRERVGEIFQELRPYKGIEILEGHAVSDHVHMCLSFTPKYGISMAIGYINVKGD